MLLARKDRRASKERLDLPARKARRVRLDPLAHRANREKLVQLVRKVRLARWGLLARRATPVSILDRLSPQMRLCGLTNWPLLKPLRLL